MSQNGRVGEVLIGKYELTAHLERGEYADFFLARRLTDGSDVALKILRTEYQGIPDAQQRFEREVRTLARFRHPNLLRVLALGRTVDGTPFVVTEYLEGRLLSHEVSGLTLSVDQVCHVGAQIARALAAAHSRGIVHRGLSPDVIYLCTEGADELRVKLLDFGLAHFKDSAGEPGITRVGQRLGRCEYMAPEYVECFALNEMTDVYVLGVILFEMLTGQPPFVGRAVNVMNKHLTEEPWAPSDMAEETVPEWLDQLILTLLAKSPKARPKARDIARALSKGRWPL